jgi:hypothetical protein
MPRPAIPEDKINLRLILVSGKTKDFLFRPNDSAEEIAQFVFENWPVGKDLDLGRAAIKNQCYNFKTIFAKNWS